MEQPDSTPTCPICGRFIDPKAEKCSECGYQFTKSAPAAQPQPRRSAEPYPSTPAAPARKNFPVWGWILIIVAVLGCLAFCVLGTGLAGILMWRSQPDPTTSSISTRAPEDDQQPLDPEENQPPAIEEDDGGDIIQIPTKKPAVTYDEVVVEQTWFMQDKNNSGQFYYGFILNNPNTDAAVENINLEAVAYDADGTILGTGSTYVSAILPGQDLAMPGYGLTIPDGAKVDRVEVRVVDTAQEKPMEMESDPFTFDKVKLYEDTYNSTVTGVMNYSGSEALMGVTVSAVGLDDSGNIVGINSSYEGLYVEPGGSTPITVTMYFNETPTRVQFYATYSPSGQSSLPEVGSLPKVSTWGYSIDSSRFINYAVILKNSADSDFFQYLSCRMVVYDKDGYVLTIGNDMIQSIFPGEQQALAGGMYLPKQAGFDEIDRVDVLVQPPTYTTNMFGSLSGGLSENPLSLSDITFFPGDYSSKVTAELKNSSSYTVNTVITAVLYDESGTIIGGAKAYPPSTPGNGKVAIEVPIYQNVDPDKVELFASISSVEE